MTYPQETLVRLARRVGKYLYYLFMNPKDFISRERVACTRDGINYLCNTDNYIERSILKSGIWEENETDSIKKVIKPGYIVFDVGANVGYFSLLMSKLVGVTGQVHCFEPTTYAIERLQNNLNLNNEFPTSNIIVNKNGLASHTETRTDSFESRFSSKILAYSDKEVIEFITIDEYCENIGIERLDFIKIDVDGYDFDIVKGGHTVFKRFKPIIMAEICNRVLLKQGNSSREYLNQYLEYGYTQAELLETSEFILLSDLISDIRMQEGTWNILLF